MLHSELIPVGLNDNRCVYHHADYHAALVSGHLSDGHGPASVRT